MSDLSYAWFEQAMKLDIGEAIYIRVENKKEQTIVARELEESREHFSKFDPITASQLFVNRVLKSAKMYVVIERKFRAPFTAIFRAKDGSFSTISIDPERKKQIIAMLKDGYPKEELETALNGLTEEEIEMFFS
jgi:hypothetical protein